MHLPVLAGHEGIELSVLVDRDRNRAEELAQGYGVKTVLTDAAELDKDRIDAAIVATPPFHHAPCSIELMRRGIHVLVEKPMATRYEDAEEMVRTADEQGVVLSVGFFRRLNPSIRLMKSLLDSGWLGRPTSFHVEGGGMYNWPAATLANMRKDWAGGGVLIDFGSHMLDLMFYLFDEPSEVIEYRDNSLGGIESDSNIRVRVRHQERAGRRHGGTGPHAGFGSLDPRGMRTRHAGIPGQRAVSDSGHSSRSLADRSLLRKRTGLLVGCGLGRGIGRNLLVRNVSHADRRLCRCDSHGARTAAFGAVGAWRPRA